MKRKIISFLLTVCILLSLLSILALADGTPIELNINDGNITITSTGYTAAGATSETQYTGDYVITGSSTTNTVRVENGTQNITIKNLNIDRSNKDYTLAFVVVSERVNLTLTGTNTLKGGSRCPGLCVPLGATLSITAESTGSLDAIGGSWGAGIGSAVMEKCGTVEINGGTINARGGDDIVDSTGAGAGIGCGGNGCSQEGTPNCNIIITGGTVTASGGDCAFSDKKGAAGIGGSYFTDCGNVAISGGTVIANGGQSGAGIGGGKYGTGGNVTITGGSVKAVAGAGAESIGHGRDATNSGSLTDGTNPVYLTKACLGANSDASAMTGLTNYSMIDAKTFDDGDAYLYLPVGDYKAGWNGYSYIGSVAADSTNRLRVAPKTDGTVMTSGTYGQALSDIATFTGTMKDPKGSTIEGTWAWTAENSGSIYPAINGQAYEATFTPNDTTNYALAAVQVTPVMSYLDCTDAAALSSATNDWYSGTVTLTAPTGYTISKVDTLTGTWAASITASDLAEGSNIVTYYLKRDSDGLVAKKDATVQSDTAVPAIGQSTFSNGTTTLTQDALFSNGKIDVTVPVTDDGSGPDHISYMLTPTGGMAQEAQTMAVTDGKATFTISKTFIGSVSITAWDKVGNVSGSTKIDNFYVEDTAPTLTITDESDKEFTINWYSQPQLIKASATDMDSGVQSISYTVDGGTASTNSNSSQTIQAQEGTHAYAITVTDKAGNTFTKTITVNQDTTAPTVPTVAVSEITDTAVTIKASSTDVGSGIQKYELKDSAGNLLQTSTDGVFHMTNLTHNTEYNWLVNIIDNVGNPSENVGSCNFKTSKKSLASAAVTLDSNSFTYDGSSHKPAVMVKLGETLLTENTDYFINYSNSNGIANDTINAGTITVTVIASDDCNYSGTATSQPTYTIMPAIPAITWMSAMQSATYTGSTAVITPPVVMLVNSETYSTENNGAIYYTYKAKDSTGDYTSGLPTNAGTYLVKAHLAAKGNYAANDNADMTLTITAATPAITWSEADNTQSVTYTGNATNISAPVVTLINNETFDGTITYSYKALNSETYADGLPTNAGTYQVKAHVVAQGNYVAADSTNELILTINKATATLTITGIDIGSGKTYDGTPVVNPTAAQISSNFADSVIYTYYANNNGAIGDELSGAPTNAGVYWVEGFIYMTENITEASDTLKFTIEKAPLTIVNGTVDSRKWDGSTTAPVTGITFNGLQKNETLAFDTDYNVNAPAFEYASVGTGKPVIAGIVVLKDTAKANNYTLAAGNLSGKGLTGEITKADGPAAPTFSAWDDVADTFTFESINGTVYKYHFNNDGWKEVPANDTTTTISVGNVAIAAGKLEVCVKETDTHNMGELLINTAEQTFTASLTGSVSLSKTAGVTYGDTLAATVSGQQEGAQFHYQWKVGDTNVGIDNSTYIIQGEAVGKTVTVIVTADSYNGSITPDTATNEVAKKAVTAVLDGTITKEYDTTATANIKLKINDADKVNTSDEITVTAPNAAYDSASIGSDKTVNMGNLTVTGAAAYWYDVSAPADVKGSITQKTISITISCTGKIYDGSTEATVAYVVNGIFGNEDVTASGTAAYDSANAGNRTVTATGVTLGGVEKDKYKLPDNMTNPTCTATIGLATPEVVWDESSKVQSVKYGKAAEITAPTVTLVNNETFGGTFTYSYKESGSTGDYTSGLPASAGTYQVKAHLASNGNYDAADSTNELTLIIEEPTGVEKVTADKAALTIGFAPGDSEDKVTQNLSLTVTGAVYGSKITWISSNPTVITVSGAVIRPDFASGDADVTVTASVYSNGVSDTKVFSLKVLKLAQTTYAVTFKDWDGKVLKTQTVNEGSGATAPGNPSREGYTFIGWNKDFGSVFSELTVVALYNVVNPAATDVEKVKADKAALTIGFVQGDSADKVTQNLSLTVTGAVYGSKITWISSNPTVISVSGVVIRPSYASGDANVTVTASVYNNGVSDIKVFSLKVLKLVQPTYTVTFMDWDGTVLKTEPVNEGSSATALGNPTRAGYTFTGWDTVFSNVTSNLTVTAQYKKNTSHSDDGGSSGGGSGTSTTDTAKTYQAAVSENGATETNAQVNVNKDTGSAVINVSADQGGIVKGGGTVAITMPSIPDAGGYAIDIPATYLSTTDTKGALTLKSAAGNIIVPSNMLAGTDGEKGQKAQISISQGNQSALSDEVKAVIGDRPIIQLTVAIDGNKTSWNNPDAPVTVSIPYKPAPYELENPESIVVWYIDGSGKAVSVPNGHYDAATGSVTFTTTHFSNYAVGYNKVSFSDVLSEAWYGRAVSYIAARGITTGTGNGCYNPEASITRGEFLVMLMRAYGINQDTDSSDNFTDAGNMYYTGYLAAAKRLGISKGIGNNTFAPDMQITRQEMFTLLYNALKEIKQLPKGNTGKQLAKYNDAQQVASWAKEALALFSEAGTINGDGDKLLPTETTTRAEMAQVLYNLMKR